MICQSCGGQVVWKGSWPNLTHTECESCGAVNNRAVDEPDESDQESE